MQWSFLMTILLGATVGLGWCYAEVWSAPTPAEEKIEIPRLIKNMDNNEEMPRHFRLMTDMYREEKAPLPTRLGLDRLYASGSAQYSEGGLQRILKAIPSHKVILVDLRQESHGFADGMAISWYGDHNWENRYKSAQEIENEQQKRLNAIVAKGVVRVYCDKHARHAHPLYFKQAFSEDVVARRLGVGYKRFYVTDHAGPSDATIDDFISFVKQLPPQTWLHFHCAAGRGRTTTFLTLYDIIRNGQQVSFKEIIARQQLLGGVDLEAMKPGTYKEKELAERYAFLQKFYAYSQANPHLEESWSCWLKQQATNQR